MKLTSIKRFKTRAFTTRTSWMLLLLLGFLAAATMPARAADDTIYGITNNSPFNIYSINPTTGAATSVGTLSFASASLARNPTTGLIYYAAINASGGRYSIATWDPATSTNTTLSSTVNIYLPRFAFKSDGTLYGMDSNNNLYTLSTSTGAILTTSGPVTGGGLATGLGGDMAFAPDGTLYMIAGTNLYRISGTTSTLVGNTGVTAPAGLAFGDNGALYASDTTAGNSRIYTLSTVNGAATLVGSSGAALSDLTALPKFANLSITKAASGSFIAGTNATYTLSISNAGPQSASAPITVKDTLPTGLTYVSGTGTGWSCSASGQVVTCTNSSAMASGGSSSITLTVTLASNVSSSVTNTASVSSPAFDSNTSNDSSSATTTITFPPDLTISKSHTGNFTQGQSGSYTITVTNSGSGPTTSTVTATDTLPTGLTYSTATGTGWSCSAAGQVVTCTSTNVVAAANSYPNITITVNVSATAPASVTNTASISGGGEINTANNSSSDATTVTPVADMTIVKTHSGNFTRGSTGTYAITATNSGAAATSGAVVTVIDTLPTGFSYVSATGTGWGCSASGQVVTCTRSNVLGAGVSYPAIGITVSVAQSAASSITNTASVSGGGQANTANDSSNDATSIVSSSDLSLTKVVSTPGSGIGSNVTFTVTLTNSGPSDASNVAVRDQLPSGLTYISSTPSLGAYNSGTGVWTVAALASGSSATLQLVARIDTLGSLTNTAQVTASDQPDPDSTPNNNNAAEDDQASASLSTSPPSVTLCKTIVGQPCPPPALPTQAPGSDISYIVTFTNSGGSFASNFVITDPIPANTDLKVGSESHTTPAGLIGVTVEYFDISTSTWSTNPVSGGGGAPAGYNRNITIIRWTFNGNLSQLAPNNTGNVSFTVRIR
jgi:uncharacterized repeat protein (TIGR01451 family)